MFCKHQYFFFYMSMKNPLTDFLKQYLILQKCSKGNKSSVYFLLEIRKKQIFSFRDAVTLTGKDSYSSDYQSEFWVQTDTKSLRDNSVGSTLCSSSQKFTPGHSHTLLRTQTEPYHTEGHLRSSYPLTSLSLNFLFTTKEENSIWF